MANNPAPRPPDWLIGTALALLVERAMMGMTWTFMVTSTLTVAVVLLALTTSRHDHG